MPWQKITLHWTGAPAVPSQVREESWCSPIRRLMLDAHDYVEQIVRRKIPITTSAPSRSGLNKSHIAIREQCPKSDPGLAASCRANHMSGHPSPLFDEFFPSYFIPAFRILPAPRFPRTALREWKRRYDANQCLPFLHLLQPQDKCHRNYLHRRVLWCGISVWFIVLRIVEEKGEVDGKEVSHCASVPRRNRTDASVHLPRWSSASCPQFYGLGGSYWSTTDYIFLRKPIPGKIPRRKHSNVFMKV